MNRYIISFFIFSILGWIWESIYCTVKNKKWANRGFLYGPLCPIYGFGGLCILIIYDLNKPDMLIKIPLLQIFMLSFFGSMVLEYVSSYILEKLFKARWWDYTDVPLNINGRTGVITSVAFGFAGVLIMETLIPFTDKLLLSIPELPAQILSLLLVAFISADATLTISALTEFQKHITAIDDSFQQHMANAVESIYANNAILYKKAVSRVVSFKLPAQKARIARKVAEKKLFELINEYKQQK